MIAGAILLFLAIFFIYILRETNPGWRHVDDIVRHADIVYHTVIYASECFDKELWNDTRQIKYLANDAKEYEKYADDVKRQLREQILVSKRKTPDASEFLQLIRVIDRIAGRSATAAIKYSKLNPATIPPPVLY